MKKGLRIALIICIFVLGSLALAGCSNEKVRTESPLKMVKNDIEKLDKKKFNTEAKYSKKYESLIINFGSYEDVSKIFKIINKNIKGQTIGTMYFSIGFSMCDEDKDVINDSIGKLQCKSIKALGMDKRLYEYSNHNWTNILTKVDALYTETCKPFKSYDDASKQKLAGVKRLWLKDDIYEDVEVFPGVEDLGIFAVVEEYDDRSSCDDITDVAVTTQRTTIPPTNKNGETKYPVEPYRERFIFNPRTFVIKDLKRLKNLPKLTSITIAPTFEKYTITSSGVNYLFAVSNVRNDIMVNEPEKNLSDNKYIKIDDLINSKSMMISGSRQATVDQFIYEDIPGNIKKAKKFKVINKRPKLKDKSIVLMCTPYQANFATKKKFTDNGQLLGDSELGNSIKRPDRAGDYRYFVYVYPIYKYVGKYSNGTKGYSETYYIQVFDMKKKKAYKPIKAASKQPEKKMSFSRTSPPKKHSGEVKKSKVYKAIKKLG